MENLITSNSSYPDFIRSPLEGSIIFIFSSMLQNIKYSSFYFFFLMFTYNVFFFLPSASEPHFFPRSPHSKQKHPAKLPFNCIVRFPSACAAPACERRILTLGNYVKVSFPLDLCNCDIWKWDHCHVVSLSKDSNWWIFHPPLPSQPLPPAAYRCWLH